MAVSVKITDVVDPKTYWAYETESEERQTKLKMVEKELKDQWAEAGEILMISRPEGLPVIVLLDGEFCRGQIKLVWSEKFKLKANVFLVDYGSTIEIEVKKKVRKLKLKDQAAGPPLAFKIILEGLYPVSMDIDWVSGNRTMQPYRKRTWDVCALRQVQYVLEICEGDGKFLSAQSFPTRRVGSLMMMKPSSSTAPGPSKFPLNKLLVKNGFAEQSSEEVEKDLNLVEPDLGFGLGATNLSSDEEEEEEGTGGCDYNPQPLLGTQQKLTSLQLYVSEETAASADTETNNKFFPFNSSSISSRGIGPWLEQRKKQGAATNSSSTHLTAPGGKVDQALQLQENLRKSRGARREEPQQQQEQEVDQSVEVSESEEDLWSQLRSNRKEGESRVRGHVLPGGVFIGKHHEDILANIQSTSGEDLKRKFTKMVCK